MADFSQSIQCTVPPGFGTQTLQGFPANLPDCIVVKILVTFPPGCAGLVGVSLFAGGSPAYPNVAGQYMAFDDYTLDQDVSNQIQTGQWDVIAYNLDINPHTLQVVFECDNLALSPAVPLSPPVSL